jgi:hypothetical protein
MFLLCAFLIRVFGDILAMAKLMRMKGANGLHPCCACKICGIRDVGSGKKTNYVPLHRPDGESLDPFSLPLHTHDEFIDNAVAVDTVPSDAEAERRAKATGINGLPILTTLSSLSFLDSFGHDLMHLIPENIIKNLLTLWTGDFKGLNEGVDKYKLRPAIATQVGDACVAAGDTTPLPSRHVSQIWRPSDTTSRQNLTHCLQPSLAPSFSAITLRNPSTTNTSLSWSAYSMTASLYPLITATLTISYAHGFTSGSKTSRSESMFFHQFNCV